MSPNSALRRPEVDLDLESIAVFIGRDNIDAALRFLDCAEKAIDELARMPGLGCPRRFNDSRLTALRSWRIQGFEKYLGFYRELAAGAGIEIIRVLHGERDLDELLSG